MEEITNKRLPNNKSLKPQSLITENEKYYLSLRKTRLESLFQKRRLKSIKTKYGISLEEIDLPPELKSQDAINKIINSPSSYEEIFTYINEIYNTANYQPNLFKYGFYLLKHKLLDDSSTNKNIPSLIQCGFFDIPKKIFQYTQSQIDKSPSDDIEDLIYNLYFIMINFSYYATEEENAPLISEDYLSYHYFLLKNESDDNIISSIISLLANLACHSYAFSSVIIEYQNEDLLELVIQYISSGIDRSKYSIVSASSELLYSYVNTIESDDPKEINEGIIEKIFAIFANLIHIKDTYYNSIWALSIISSISPVIFNSILSYPDVFSSMICFNYNDDCNTSNNSDCLIPFIKIITNLFKQNSNNEGKYYNELNSILELNLFDFITKIIQEYKKSKKMKEKYVMAIYSICNCDKRFIVYMINNNAPLIALLIEMIRDPHYSIKEKAIEIFYSMTILNSFSITTSLVTQGLMKMVVEVLQPDLTNCLDCNILLNCLQTINNILLTGEVLKKVQSTNSLAVKFENMGGRDILEKYLGHANNAVYQASQLIIDAFYS